MTSFLRMKNRMIAMLTSRSPLLAKRIAERFPSMEVEDIIPWQPFEKPLSECRVSLVTTAGVHHKDQKPFDMQDTEGDSTFRVIDASRPVRDLMITHDYYDHSDADRDINIVFPIERLKEFEKERVIGQTATMHYAFMGHITGRHVETLLYKSAPEVAMRLKADGVHAVVLVPG
jgi:D-proline reductase (dithiol) PrdB